MKKIIGLFGLVLLLSGCNWKTTVSGSIGIPQNISHIEFWNGGSKIFEADNAKCLTKIDTAEKLAGKSISFYRYEVTVNGKTTIIVDSEALAIIYNE